ncbi:MAG: acyl-CoA/acyl-ACP dehydrogenase [Dehalococcoidia bacterium]|nr:acyl-CoA/acyl-ACP dehydrogenase [Dehalococcoidia bacterium]
MYTGEKYLWWNDAEKKLADEVADFADNVIRRDIDEIERTKKFPWNWFEAMGAKGWFGVFIPEEYGGMGRGIGKTTGFCIILEEIARGAPVAVDFYETTLYGYSPLVRFGTEQQKRRWLPRLATGDLFAAIVITEPFMGSDAANIQATARLQGDEYFINGKKRFITLGGIANLYVTYCRTSDDPEDRKNYRHLSAFVVEKGTPGFSVEAIHDPMGRFGSRHAVLDFDNVRVPRENMILNEGDGWKVLTDALNIERLGVAAGAVGTSRAAIAATADYVTRRVAFNQTLAEIPGVQTMCGDMVTRTELIGLLVFYSAHKMDLGMDVPLGCTIAKVFATQSLMQTVLDSVQCHGGDGYMRNYPVERLMRDSKLIEIGAGANELMQHLVWRLWLKDYLTLRSASRKPVTPRSIAAPEANRQILNTLADFYCLHPALYMEREELMERLGLTAEDLDRYLLAMEKDRDIALYRKRGSIALAKATYEGLKKAKPLEYYKFFPEFVDKEREVF